MADPVETWTIAEFGQITVEQQADQSWAVFKGGGFLRGGFLLAQDARQWADRWFGGES